MVQHETIVYEKHIDSYTGVMPQFKEI